MAARVSRSSIVLLMMSTEWWSAGPIRILSLSLYALYALYISAFSSVLCCVFWGLFTIRNFNLENVEEPDAYETEGKGWTKLRSARPEGNKEVCWLNLIFLDGSWQAQDHSLHCLCVSPTDLLVIDSRFFNVTRPMANGKRSTHRFRCISRRRSICIYLLIL